jgi:hypothetical protein
MSTLSQFAGSSVIKSIQRGTISITGGAAYQTATATISSVSTAKSVLNFLGVTSVDNEVRAISRIDLTNSTTVTATRYFGNTFSSTIVSYEVIEFN